MSEDMSNKEIREFIKALIKLLDNTTADEWEFLLEKDENMEKAIREYM